MIRFHAVLSRGRKGSAGLVGTDLSYRACGTTALLQKRVGTPLARVLLSFRISPRYLQSTVLGMALSGETVAVGDGYSAGNFRLLTWVGLAVCG